MGSTKKRKLAKEERMVLGDLQNRFSTTFSKIRSTLQTTLRVCKYLVILVLIKKIEKTGRVYKPYEQN
jgi:hypothetical protein